MAKDIFGRQIETGEEIVERTKKEFEGKDKAYMYPYIVGTLTACYNSLRIQIEVEQEHKSKKQKSIV